MGGANQLGDALWKSRHKIIVFLGSVLCIVVIMGSLMYIAEGGEHGFTSIPKSIYWAIVTITTVGYGDIAPGTLTGQTIASILMILGYAIMAVPTGIVTHQFIKQDKPDQSPMKCPRCLTLDLPTQSNYCLNCGKQLND